VTTKYKDVFDDHILTSIVDCVVSGLNKLSYTGIYHKNNGKRHFRFVKLTSGISGNTSSHPLTTIVVLSVIRRYI